MEEESRSGWPRGTVGGGLRGDTRGGLREAARVTTARPCGPWWQFCSSATEALTPEGGWARDRERGTVRHHSKLGN